MGFSIRLLEGKNRGFLSNYLTILTSFRTLEAKGIKPEDICVSPSMFMLYGKADNWFDETKVTDNAEQEFNSQNGWDLNYCWPSYRDLDLKKYIKYFPFNERVSSLINSIDRDQYSNCLGVHYRGTDGIGHTEFVSVDQYIDCAIEEYKSGDYDSIFIATDEQGIVEKFRERFVDVKLYSYDHQRTDSKSGLHYSIDAEPNSPERILAGDEVLVDATTLSICKTIIGKSSNITNYARVLNPSIEILYQDLSTSNDHGDHGNLNHDNERFAQIRTQDIQPFIFNWRGQFEKSCAIEDSLKEIFGEVTVINSDEQNTRPGWIQLDDHAYFTKQWVTALDLLKPEKKVLMHCQGDTVFNNYKELVKDARKYFNLYEWGVYAPDVTNVWYTSQHTDIHGIKSEDQNIKMVACTDETVWFIHRDIIDDYYERGLDKLMTHETMKMGWGWDMVYNAISFTKGRPVIRDYNHRIQHAKGTNYNKNIAVKEMVSLVESLQPDLREAISYIKGDREKLIKYFE